MRIEKIFSFVLITGVFAFAKTPGDPVHGKQIYESRCTGCHSVDTNRTGPKHFGVFGRKAGALADYEYSTALKKSRFKWSEKNLDQWLKGPNSFVPGSKMGFSVPIKADRLDLISYLKTLKSK
ncbi:MAG: c-type cytochrome [Pseudobdellovibrio sp.]